MSVLRSCLLQWLLLATALLPARAHPLDEVLRECRADSLKPGYGLCLFDARGEIWSKYEGLANEDADTPFSRNTILRVGGVSEIFTVVMALRLVEAGLLDPEQPISAYLPRFFSGSPRNSPLERISRLKVRVLMSHLSGTDACFFLGFRDYDPFRDLRNYLQDVNLKYPPETKHLRSSAMIDLLGLAVETVSGTEFESLAQATLFEPLGMKASSFRYRESPLYASIRYKSAAPDSYATRIPGFRDVVAPSGSMQSSLGDLVSFYATLLGNSAGTGASLLATETTEAMFSSQSEAVARRQGLRVGYVWKVSLPELAHLGRVAWYSGKHLSHRNVVILLPDLGIGVACATNAWSIFDRETILPLAVGTLRSYARETLKVPDPPRPVPARIPVPRTLRTQVDGLYASPYGVYRVRSKGSSIVVSSSAIDATLEHGGHGAFHSVPDGIVERIMFRPPDTLELSLKNGMAFDARKALRRASHRPWLKRTGTYRIIQSGPGTLYAFTLGSFEGLPVISGDDGTELLLEPRSAAHASVRCDESSRLFGQELQVAGQNGLLLDGVPYRLVR